MSLALPLELRTKVPSASRRRDGKKLIKKKIFLTVFVGKEKWAIDSKTLKRRAKHTPKGAVGWGVSAVCNP